MEPLELAAGPVEVVLLPEHGARLHRIRAFGVDLLRTPPQVEQHAVDPFFWGGFVMAPWCNRIAGTPLDVGGRRVAVPPNFADGSAIHGQVYARRWEVVGDGRLRVRGGGDGWPWRYEVRLAASLADRALRLVLELENLDSAPMPGGIGIHPWWRRPLVVAIPGDRVYPSLTPSAAQPVPVSGEFDLRAPRPMPPGMDAAWSGMSGAPVTLAWPEEGVRANISLDAPQRLVVAASPPDLAAVAVEPQTHAPQGLRRLLADEPDPLQWLAVGEVLALELAITFEELRA